MAAQTIPVIECLLPQVFEQKGAGVVAKRQVKKAVLLRKAIRVVEKPIHQAVGLQLLEDFADGNLADAQLCGQLVNHQPCARLEVVGQDGGVQKIVGDVLFAAKGVCLRHLCFSQKII